MDQDWHGLISQPRYEIELEEDVWVTMRDGVRLCVDIYRPRASGRFPSLVSFSWYGKDQEKLPTNPVWQPSDYIRGTGGHECGEQWYFVPRGYVQVIPDIRGTAKSEGVPRQCDAQDGYDLIQWIAQQPWSNGNVGMIGMSAFAGAQYPVAAQAPPALRAIFPFEGATGGYRQSNFRGGIFQYFFSLHGRNLVPVRSKSQPRPAAWNEFSPEELSRRIEALQTNPDIQCLPYLYLTTLSPEMNPRLFDTMMHPFDDRTHRAAPLSDIHIPTYSGSRWNGWSVHLQGAFDGYENIAARPEQKKLLMIPSDNYGGMDRPFHEVQDVCLRWYDHWLNSNDTGLMDEPPITLFLQGVNRWRYETQWPLEATQWTKFYLRENGGLSLESPNSDEAPQTFVSSPWARPSGGYREADLTSKADPIPKAIYETPPLSEAVEMTGPIALYWQAAIESRPLKVRRWNGSPVDGITTMEPTTNDTDWYLKIKDIDVDGYERCVAEGMLKASHYELDAKRSKPYAPYHPHTRNLPIPPGEVIEYAADLMMGCNVFLAGHRIRLEISAQDLVQALWYRLPHMAEVKHTIFSVGSRPSYLLLPIIPKGYTGAGEPAYPLAGPFRIGKYQRP